MSTCLGYSCPSRLANRTERQKKRRNRMRYALICLLVPALVVAMAQRAAARHNTVLVNRVGPSSSALYIANIDGSGERPLLDDGTFEYDASFSSDGQWIVFTSERSGSSDIYRARVDGSGLERLTDDPGFDDQAAFSPDGRQVAFVSARGAGNTNIWILDLKTRKTRNVTSSAALRVPAGKLSNYYRPAWSPDGRWLAFSSDRGTTLEPHKVPFPGWEHVQHAGVYVMRSDGSELRKLSNDAEFAGSPKWSADGRHLIYYSSDPALTFAARFMPMGNTSQIVTVDVQSGQRTERSSGPGLKISPQFVDGDRIGYLDKTSNRAELAYSSGERVAPPGDQIRNPAWSPDGKQVVYQRMIFALKQGQPIYSRDRQFSLRFSGEFPAVSTTGKVALTPFSLKGSGGTGAGLGFNDVGVYVSDLDGANLRQVFHMDGGAAYAPSWSPDGQSIVVGFGTFLVMRQARPAQLLLMQADGSQAHPLTSDQINSGFPHFSPDGKRIVFRVWGKNERGLRILDLNSGNVTVLTSQRDNFPFYSPKGDRICFTRDVGTNEYDDYDIFTVRPDGSDLRRLTNAPGNDAHCAWSPDGRDILFVSARFGLRDETLMYDGSPQPYAELFVMRADGSGQSAITSDKWEEGTPAWVP